MRIDLQSKLTDRERILLHIINGLAATMVLAPNPKAFDVSGFRRHGEDSTYVHFARWDDEPKVGELVIANSGGVGEYKVGWFMGWQDRSVGLATIREIGSQNLCNYGNESFTPIRGLMPEQLFEGEQYRFYIKTWRAFSRGDEYSYRFGGLRFDGDEAVITIREVFAEPGSIPFKCRMKYGKRTSVKSILKAMRDAGYGTRRFERRPLPVQATTT